MKLSFHGAARTVTGSKHLLTLDNGRKYLLDCGMFQGMGKQTDTYNRNWGFSPAEIDYLILSHAHIDHTGLIPRLVNHGFKGAIFCTPATKDLAMILLEDSAEIQEEDTKFTNKRRVQEGMEERGPLYTRKDVADVLSLLTPVNYNEWFRVDDQLELLYTDAGHIIGSAAVHLRVQEGNRSVGLTFSGDIGRYNDMILRSPQPFPQADYIIMESTYGNRLHDPEITIPELLLEWIRKTCLQKRGKLVIPAFSVGRTQEILFALNQLEVEGRLPALDYYVDSPMSIEVTQMVKRYPDYYNDTIQQLLKKDHDPFSFRGLNFVKTVEESKALNYKNEPFVVISASGMADSGRVKHHISNTIENSRNTILLVSYAEPFSLAGRLLSGAKEVRIFGIDHEVHAEVGSIRSMSAHGDYEDLLQFLSGQEQARIKKLFLVHGDYEVQLDFQKMLISKGFLNVEVPELHETITLT